MTQGISPNSIHAVDPGTLTPAMRQYQQYKTQHPDCILFFRMGDFYELFYEDARTAAQVLGVALTSRSKGENPVPMAGIPYHALETYLQRMISAGFKVAICEQMEDPKLAKGVVKREVTRLVTPGTLTDETMLDGREENFIAAVVLLESKGSRSSGGAPAPENGAAAVAWCELSTGKFQTLTGPAHECLEELARIQPKELIYAEPPDHRIPDWAQQLRASSGVTLSPRPAWQLDTHHAVQALKSHYGVVAFEGFGYAGEDDPALRPGGALVTYLLETQKAALEHLRPPQRFCRADFLVIDPTSLRSLEVLRTIRGHSAAGSLVAALDRTCTPMGARLLKNWLCYPLRNGAAILRRQDAVAGWLAHPQALAAVRTLLGDCQDIERISARICCRRAGPRDLLALARSLEILVSVAQALETLRQARVKTGGFDNAADHAADPDQRAAELDTAPQPTPGAPPADLPSLAPAAAELAAALRQAIADDPPAHLRDGRVMRDGFHEDLDRLRALARDSRAWLAEYQAKLAQTTGISSLKVGYNRVFGFYIEISHAHVEKIPPEFTRKQTIKNAERYITPELKQYESEILTAQERAVALEQELFEQLRQQIAAQVQRLQAIAQAAATLDVLAGLADLAQSRHYCRPQITAPGPLLISDGRHPVVEQALGEAYVPNDTEFSIVDRPARAATLHLITGPNMAGKSTYIRQVALLVLMAQAGSFVPAKSATIGLVDRIFTRVGASDDLAGGQSTFMVEMTETANILHHATADSLVILDEIGRGTSTLDGLALAWAIAEFLADTTQARTLFATHYHELTELAETNPAVANYNVLVREWEDQVIFMHRITPGTADRSYGVHVARLAGVPRSIITRARTLMNQLSVQVGKIRPRAAGPAVTPQLSMFEPADQQALAQLRALDLERMSPMQAWEALRRLRQMADEKR